jgi:TonB family protein
MRILRGLLLATTLIASLPAVADQAAYNISDPSLTKRPELNLRGVAAPAYPPGAHSRGEWGTVVVTICVSSKGKITDPKVAESSGSDDLDKAVVDWLRKAKAHPAQVDGSPVAVCGFPVEWEWKNLNAMAGVYPRLGSRSADTPPIRTGGPDTPEASAQIDDPLLKSFRKSGVVQVNLCIGPDGKVETLANGKSIDNPLLVKLTLQWAAKQTFSPATKDGVPVGVCGVPIEYDWPKRQ